MCEPNYESKWFAATLIPTNTFSMLPTQEAQIRTLGTISAHLAPAGKLLLDVRLAGVRNLCRMGVGRPRSSWQDQSCSRQCSAARSRCSSQHSRRTDYTSILKC
jgi:hypothetical protein